MRRGVREWGGGFRGLGGGRQLDGRGGNAREKEGRGRRSVSKGRGEGWTGGSGSLGVGCNSIFGAETLS